MSLELNSENFEQIISSTDQPVVVDFWAEWCGPCKTLGPIVDELSLDYADRAIVGKVNVDASPEIALKYGIRNIPTIFIFKDGKVVDRQTGVAPKSILALKIDVQLSNVL